MRNLFPQSVAITGFIQLFLFARVCVCVRVCLTLRHVCIPSAVVGIWRSLGIALFSMRDSTKNHVLDWCTHTQAACFDRPNERQRRCNNNNNHHHHRTLKTVKWPNGKNAGTVVEINMICSRKHTHTRARHGVGSRSQNYTVLCTVGDCLCCSNEMTAVKDTLEWKRRQTTTTTTTTIAATATRTKSQLSKTQNEIHFRKHILSYTRTHTPMHKSREFSDDN